jgi:hypothetical protein
MSQGEFVQQREKNPAAERIARFEAVFLRLVALVLLALAIEYWMRVTGLLSGPESAFDNMPNHWRVVSASLAVVLPVAALGLWGLHTWGIVVWIGAAMTEIAMHGLLQSLFGADFKRLAFHLVALAILAGFFVARQMTARRRVAAR